MSMFDPDEFEVVAMILKWSYRAFKLVGISSLSSAFSAVFMMLLGFFGYHATIGDPPQTQQTAALYSPFAIPKTHKLCSCDDDDTILMRNAKAYYNGRHNVPINKQKAICLLTCVANDSSSKWMGRANNRIAFAFWTGQGVAQVRKASFLYWQKGAEAGDEYALTAYARYCTDRWVDMCDAELAEQYLDQAVEKGFGPAIQLQKERRKKRLAAIPW